MEFRRIFDTIPQQFDQYRPRYCAELFSELISHAQLAKDTTVLEIGPGTGQATEPVLRTGCNYHAIELGENLAQMMRSKYSRYENFHLICDDFITYDFGNRQFDLIYSAAAIQWIPEAIAFAKTFQLLKPGGILAMMLTRSDFKTPNEALFEKIQQVYDQYFRPEIRYEHASFCYANAQKYGYTDFKIREFYGERRLTAEEYVGFSATHCDHLVLPESCKSKFFEGLRTAVLEAGDQIVFRETHQLMTAKKPE